MKWWFRKQLYTQIAIGGLAGIIIGFILGEKATFFEPIGDIFIRLLQMLIVPLVITSILAGIMKMKDAKSLGSIGVSFMIYLIITSLISTTIGVCVALLIQPGQGDSNLLDINAKVETVDFNFTEQFLSWIPTNFFQSMAEMDMLQIIIFTILFGIVMLSLGEDKVPGITKLVNESANIMLRFTSFIIKLAPYGILALLANLVGTMGTDVITTAISFILTDFIALVIVLLIIYPLVLKLTTGLDPIRFYKNIYPSMLFAFTTSTSNATIPVSFQVSKNNLGINKKVSSFTVPFGATVNMDGFAVALGVICIFAANIYEIPITFGLIIQFILLGLVLSIGAAGVRGAGIVMSTVLLETLGMPLAVIPILAAIWPIIDIGHTTLNITGDLTGTTVVSKRLNLLDESVYNQENSPLDVDHSDTF